MTDLIESKPGTQGQFMTDRQQRIGAFAATLLLLLGSAGAASAVDLNLTNSVVGFHNPVGIDFQDISGKLILTANYPTGLPDNLELVDPGTGVAVPFSSLVGLTNELKVATVRAGNCQGGFTAGESFTGNGNLGQIVRISANGATVQNPWLTLPGEPALLRGSIGQDRFCASSGDLIVVTGNEQNGTAANDNIGNVWRITSAGVPSLIATVGTHLEGVTTIPNVPALYGPLAGRILAGAEEFLLLGRPNQTAADYNPDGGAIYVIDPNGSGVWFTISNGHLLAAPCLLDINGQATPNHCNFHTAAAFHPEDLDVIRRNSQFFGVAYTDGQVLTTQPADFDPFCAQVLITQESPFAGTSGLSALSWDGTQFVARPLTTNRIIQQWEHVTFTAGQDCVGPPSTPVPTLSDVAMLALGAIIVLTGLAMLSLNPSVGRRRIGHF